MSNLQINEGLCIRCGACIKECPTYVLCENENNYPSVNKDFEAGCAECGHCEAVCKQKAITLVDEELDEPLPIAKETVTVSQIDSLFKTRRTIRKFKKEAVDRSMIDKILAGVRYAPSANNVQPVKWIIVHSADQMNKLTEIMKTWLKELVQTKPSVAEKFDAKSLLTMFERGINPVFREAPHLAVTYTHKDALTPLIDSAIALSYLDIALPVYNLGGCWAGFFCIISSMCEEISKELRIPQDHAITGGMLFGYPNVTYYNVPKRKKIRVEYR